MAEFDRERQPTDEGARFVRETLGCGCPDEVVARTVLDRSERGEPGLDVGGKLLVRVLTEDDPAPLAAALPEIVLRLREERDRRGFNRLRVVVAHDRLDVVVGAFGGVFEALGTGDDRLHLHVLPRAGVPDDLLGGGGRGGRRRPRVERP